MKKRILTVLLLLALLASTVPSIALPASAEGILYDATIGDNAIYIGGVKMTDESYLPEGGTIPVGEKPATGGYAYVYYNGTKPCIELHNYHYTGEGFVYNTVEQMSAVIFSNVSSSIEIETFGVCFLKNTKKNGSVLINAKGSTYVDGDSLLTMEADLPIISMNGVTLENTGRTTVNANETAVQCSIFECKNLTVNAKGNGIIATRDVYVSGGVVEINAGDYGIYLSNPQNTSDNICISGRLKVTAKKAAISSETREICFYYGEAELIAFASGEGGVAVNNVLEIDKPDDHLISYGNSATDLTVQGEVYSWSTHADSTQAAYLHVAVKPKVTAATELTVAGVKLTDGDYLKSNVYTPTKEKPAEGGYAYYKDGVLTLNGYRHVSAGSHVANTMEGSVGSVEKDSALIVANGDLKILLEGESYLENTNKHYGSLITAKKGNIELFGSGTLDGKATVGILPVKGDLTVRDVTLFFEVTLIESTEETYRRACGLYAYDDILISDATIDIKCHSQGNVHGILTDCNDVNVERSAINIVAIGDLSSLHGCGIGCGYEINCDDSAITVKGFSRGIDGLKQAKNCSFVIEAGYYALNAHKFYNCTLELSAEEYLFFFDTEFIGCTVEGSCSGIAFDEDVTLINTTAEITAKYLTADGEIEITGGSLTATASGSMFDYKEDLIPRCDLTVSYGDSADSLTVNAQPYNMDTHGEAIKNTKYLKLVCPDGDVSLRIDGKTLQDGEYYVCADGSVDTSKPEGGYAYYKDGVLTLHSFAYKGTGFDDGAFKYNCVISALKDLTVVLEGENVIEQEDKTEGLIAIACMGDLTVRGGSLQTVEARYGFYGMGDVVLENVITGQHYDPDNSDNERTDVSYGDMTVNGGSYRVMQMESEGSFTLHGGELDVGFLGAMKDLTVNDGVVHAEMILGGGRLVQNGGELNVVDGGGWGNEGIVSGQKLTVNGGKLSIVHDYPIVIGDDTNVPEFLGGTVEIISDGGVVFNYECDTPNRTVKIGNCNFTIKGFMIMPEFDLSGYAACNATYSMKSDFSDVKTYTGEPIEFCFLFEVTPAGSVAFNANGGSGEMATVNELSGSVALPECTFTAPTGKMFKGWSLTADGAALVESVYVEGEVTVYAIWENDPDYTPGGTTPEGTTPDGSDPDGSNGGGDDGDPGTDDDKDGLGIGAIIGIIIGVLTVLGGGGFALYWFVLRKKPTTPIAPASTEAPEVEAPETVSEDSVTDAPAETDSPNEGENQ